MIQFVFHFYGFETYNMLVNPNNRLVKKVLTRMVKSDDYFFFAKQGWVEVMMGAPRGLGYSLKGQACASTELGPIFS